MLLSVKILTVFKHLFVYFSVTVRFSVCLMTDLCVEFFESSLSHIIIHFLM